MKVKITYSLAFLCLISLSSIAQTSIGPGELAIVEYNADNPDKIALVTLVPLDSGTQFHLTDNGWMGSGFRTGEGTITWNADSNYACGSIIIIDSMGAISLSASGDQLFAYQGSDTNPSFIFGFNNDGAAIWQNSATSTTTSGLPQSLTNGVNAVAVFETDNIFYNGIVTGTKAGIQSSLFDSSNFSGNNSNAVSFTDTFNISGACALPVNLISFDYVLHQDNIELNWQTASEINNRGFEVESSFDGRDFVNIGWVDGRGTSNEINHYSFLMKYATHAKYVRLRQLDYDGTEVLSQIISIQNHSMGVEIEQGPSQIRLAVLSDSKVQLWSMQGVLIETFEVEENLVINSDALIPGSYLIQITTAHQSKAVKWMVW